MTRTREVGTALSSAMVLGLSALGLGLGLALALSACASRPKTPLGPPPEYEEPAAPGSGATAGGSAEAGTAPSVGSSADGGPR